jgi:hypothetical protein
MVTAAYYGRIVSNVIKKGEAFVVGSALMATAVTTATVVGGDRFYNDSNVGMVSCEQQAVEDTGTTTGNNKLSMRRRVSFLSF